MVFTRCPKCTGCCKHHVLYAQINYDQNKAGDKIPFTMFLDDTVTACFILYRKGNHQYKYGKVRAIKLNRC
jgi:hypothetical protein